MKFIPSDLRPWDRFVVYSNGNHRHARVASMFAIALKHEQYKTYILSDQLAHSRLEVVPERGGIVTQWSIRGREILYFDAERFANPDLSVRGGIPILFPICGNLPNNSYTLGDQSYSLKQHGFARDLPWQVSDRKTQEAVALQLTLTSNDVTRAVYPFEFTLNFTYRLQGNSLHIDQQVINHSSVPMPFSLGLHPYFNVADKSQLRFDIPDTELQDHRDLTTHFFSGQFDFDADEIDVIFHNPSRSGASVTDLSNQTQLRLTYQDPYNKLVFWTVKGKDYYCLEPWSAARNAMNTGDRLTHLAPGESLETSVQLTVLFQQ